MEYSLSGVKTCELVEEIKKREGVDIRIAEPDQEIEMSVKGPATVIVVID